MPARIVTSTYRYKRPPRKRKAVPLDSPVIVRSGRKREEASQPATPAPANDDRKPAIVTAARRGHRQKPEPEINPEAEARVQAFLARVMGPP
jgi:hypothetical protein